MRDTCDSCDLVLAEASRGFGRCGACRADDATVAFDDVPTRPTTFTCGERGCAGHPVPVCLCGSNQHQDRVSYGKRSVFTCLACGEPATLRHCDDHLPF